MKRIFPILFFLFLSISAFSQNVLELFTKSNDFFELMRKNQFHDAYAFFGDTLKNKLPEATLEQLWGNIITNFGEVKSLDAIASKRQGNFFPVTVEGKFKIKDQNFLLVFDQNEKIVGLFVAPKTVAVEYSLPKYADSTLYREESIYVGPAGHQLAAMLTIPKNIKNFPLVVLVHGSGPSDMDESIGPNKPFKDIAAGLASNGIASIRYVKRTLVYPNEFSGAFTVDKETVNDAVAAVQKASETINVNKKEIYVFGHSLGGMLAPRIASKIPNLAGIIIAASPARSFVDIILEQNKTEFAKRGDTTTAAKLQFEKGLKEVENANIKKLGNMKPDSSIIGLPASYWIDLNNYDQVETAKKLAKTRILILQGGNDFQVGKIDFDLWEKRLARRKNTEFKFYPTLNHFFTEQTEKGTLAQYDNPAEVSATVINDVTNWIKGK